MARFRIAIKRNRSKKEELKKDKKRESKAEKDSKK